VLGVEFVLLTRCVLCVFFVFFVWFFFCLVFFFVLCFSFVGFLWLLWWGLFGSMMLSRVYNSKGVVFCGRGVVAVVAVSVCPVLFF